jgi:hypothetical protein
LTACRVARHRRAQAARLMERQAAAQAARDQELPRLLAAARASLAAAEQVLAGADPVGLHKSGLPSRRSGPEALESRRGAESRVARRHRWTRAASICLRSCKGLRVSYWRWSAAWREMTSRARGTIRP